MLFRLGGLQAHYKKHFFMFRSQAETLTLCDLVHSDDSKPQQWRGRVCGAGAFSVYWPGIGCDGC